MKPYSQDLRDRIIQALEVGTETQRGIAERCCVSRSFGRETLAPVAPEREQCGEAPRGGAAERPHRPSRSPAECGGPAARCHARRLTGAARGRPGPPCQHGYHLPRLTAAQPAAKKKS